MVKRSPTGRGSTPDPAAATAAPSSRSAGKRSRDDGDPLRRAPRFAYCAPSLPMPSANSWLRFEKGGDTSGAIPHLGDSCDAGGGLMCGCTVQIGSHVARLRQDLNWCRQSAFISVVTFDYCRLNGMLTGEYSMKARRIAMYALALCLISGPALAVRLEYQPFGAYYNRATGTVMDVLGVSQDNGARVGHWWNVNGENQRFREIYYYDKPWWSPTEVFQGIKVQAKHSGRCLDVPNGNAYNGAPVQQWDCNGLGKAQFWDKRSQGDGYWSFILKSNTNYCVDLPYGSSIGTPLTLYRCNDSRNQGWKRY